MHHWSLLSGVSIALPLALSMLGCGGVDPLTCDDPVDTTVSVGLLEPIKVDPSKPDEPVTISVRSIFQVSCQKPADTVEIASAALVDFDTDAKVLDVNLRFAGGAEGVPVCEGAAGTHSVVKVVVEGLTNGALASQCGRQDLGLRTVITRSGCAPTSAATRIAKELVKVQCQ